MKSIIIVFLSIGLSGCSMLGGGTKHAPEVVASCFSEGDNQELYCKMQRRNEQGRIVVTRCIGALNQEAAPATRGKCAEKTCSEGSQTDCQVRGEHLVLQQYADLATARLFADEESRASKKASARRSTKSQAATKEVSAKKIASIAVVKPPVIVKKTEVEEEPVLALTLKPAKNRTPAAASDDGDYKRVCIAKNDKAAPEIMRGKCATRTCVGFGKCTYQGRKEMFDYVARTSRDET